MLLKSYTFSASANRQFPARAIGTVLHVIILFTVIGYCAFAQVTNDGATSRFRTDTTGTKRQDSTLSAALASVASDSTRVESYDAALKVYKERKQYSVMMNVSARMVKQNPSSALANFIRGDVMLDNGDPDAAIDYFKTTLMLDPTFVRAYVALAESYAMMKNVDSAIAELDTAITMNSRYAQAYIQRGGLLQGLNRLKEAAADFRRAADLLPNSFEPWLKAGQVSLQAGEYEDAEDALKYARQLNSINSEVLVLLGDAQAGRQEYHDAYISYDEYLTRYSTSATAQDVWRKLRRVYSRLR